MKIISVLIFSLTLFSSANAQDLKGEWYGEYTYNFDNSSHPIGLEIIYNTDSTLNITTYSMVRKNGFDTVSPCKVIFKKHRKGLLELTEVTDDYQMLGVLQIFYLRYKKEGEDEFLKGNWKLKPYTVKQNELYNYGSVTFKKIKLNHFSR